MWEVKNVDAMLRSVQTRTQESQASRSHSLRVRLGVVAPMAIVIEYYVLQKFRKQSRTWIPPSSAERSSCFPHWKRSQHDVLMQRLKHAPGKSAASQAELGNCQE
jgi:peptidyl-tRNA hydrolase